MSISNQKSMLRDFAKKNGMFQHEYYVDDGYTGCNFNRPVFQCMIADIKAGKIGCVITKDLFRLVKIISKLEAILKSSSPNTMSVISPLRMVWTA